MRQIFTIVIRSLGILAACRKSSGNPSLASSDSSKFVSVNFMGAALISPPSRLDFSVAASWGSKMVFGCAEDEYAQVYSDSAYVYDTIARQWSKFRIGALHGWGAAVACGGKIFLAGGDSGNVNFPTSPVTVDIYDVASGQWSTARLNSARPVTAAAAGSTVIFAGGIVNNNVDIFDVSTGQWAMANLSLQRTDIGAAGAGTKIVFAGGYNGQNDDVDNVDIYDVTTKLWSTAALSVPRGVISAAAAGTKLVFAGGWHAGYSKVVDVYDVTSATWTASALSIGHNYSCAVSSGNMILFAGGWIPNGQNNALSLPYFDVDVYNATTGIWGSTPLPTANPRVTGAAAGNQVLFAYCPGTYDTLDSVEIFHLQ